MVFQIAEGGILCGRFERGGENGQENTRVRQSEYGRADCLSSFVI